MVLEEGGQLLKGYVKGYKRAFNQVFTGFPRDVGFNNGLSCDAHKNPDGRIAWQEHD